MPVNASMSRATARGIALGLALAVAAGSATSAADEPNERPTDPGHDLLFRMVTEEVEPGVDRILSDGFRELSPPVEGYVFDGVGKGWGFLARSHQYRHVVAAPDGSVWIFEPDRFFRLGRKKEWGWKGQPELLSGDEFEVAPGGTLWRASGRWPQEARSFDGKGWTRHRPKKFVRSIEIEPDGTVWTTRWRPVGADGTAIDELGRLHGKRWNAVALPRLKGSYGDQFEVTGSDEVWVCCKKKPWSEEQQLARFDGRRWETVEDPSQGRADAPLLIDGTDDGTLWMRWDPSTLARHDDDGWTVFTAGEDDPVMGWTQIEGGFLRAAPDGSVWVTVSTGKESGNFDCDGLARFDGAAWSRYLSGSCVFAIDVTSDGTAWVQAARMDPEDEQGLPLEPIQTYAIRQATISEAKTEAPDRTEAES